MRLRSVLSAIALGPLAACATQQPLSEQPLNSELTQGNVELTIERGVTTKAEVLEAFGAPNVTTVDSSGNDVWSYQRAAQTSEAQASSDYWTVILAGQSRQAAGFQSTSRMMTLIIKFSEEDVVSDFRSRSSNF